MKNKKINATLVFISIMLISIIAIIIFLIPFNLEKLKILACFLFSIVVLYKLWNIETYGFICLNCGYEFKRGIIDRIFSNRKCPICNDHNILKESFSYYYFKGWSDLDED